MSFADTARDTFQRHIAENAYPGRGVVVGVAVAEVADAVAVEVELGVVLHARAVVRVAHRQLGQRRAQARPRVGLARALAADPDVLLMDEPFSALDPLIRRQLQDEFIKLSASMNKTTVFITHDLDEAVRIGDRIAIMRDGEVVQIGTAEDIVMHPADDYVTDFVAGISRLKVVRAHAVMQDINSYETEVGPIPPDAPRVAEDESLSELIRMAINSDVPIIVQDDGRDVGVINRSNLLQTVIEGTEVS